MDIVEAVVAAGRGALIISGIVFVVWSIFLALLFIAEPQGILYTEEKEWWRLVTWTAAAWVGLIIALAGWSTR